MEYNENKVYRIMKFNALARQRPKPSPGGEGGSPKARRMRNGEMWQYGMHLIKMAIIFQL